MIRGLLTLFVIGALAFCGATVPLGKRTFFGHVSAIWTSEQMGELKEGVKEKAGPAMKKAECKVKKGIDGECEDPTPAEREPPEPREREREKGPAR